MGNDVEKLIALITAERALSSDQAERHREDMQNVTADVKDIANSMHEIATSIQLSISVQQTQQKDIEKAEIKIEKHDDRIRVLENSIGVGNVFDEINKNKIKNIVPWSIAALSLMATMATLLLTVSK